jgi:hypothetical protein
VTEQDPLASSHRGRCRIHGIDWKAVDCEAVEWSVVEWKTANGQRGSESLVKSRIQPR